MRSTTNRNTRCQSSSRGRMISRRQFLGAAAAGAALVNIVPRHVLGGTEVPAPNDRLNVAGIGIGGMGKNDIAQVATTENVVALCDVDDAYAAPVFAQYPNAERHRDFRRMFEARKDIDAVIIATPDHLHAAASMAAIQLGKHVYCEKPLTHTVYEARKLLEAARNAKVATQMGNHGHSSEGIRLVCEWIWDGAIGTIQRVDAWTTLPRGIWTQGIGRPADTPPVPETLDWDLWLGPSPVRSYNPAYHPVLWRGWWDFGTGALGDQACHTLDVPFWALKLGSPSVIESSNTPINEETFPVGSIVRFEFPAREGMPPVKLTWYDGGLMPERPEGLPHDRRMGNEYGGVLFYGDKGTLLCGTFGENPRLLPDAAMEAYQRPAKTIPRSTGHHADWVAACKGGAPAGSNFEYAAPLTEVAMLGNIAIRTGRRLEWNASALQFVNDAEADLLINPPRRAGWEL